MPANHSKTSRPLRVDLFGIGLEGYWRQFKVRSLKVYHGKAGRGLSVEMSLKHGPVPLLSVAETSAGKSKRVVAEGDSVQGPILEIGNTNSRYCFPVGARKFVNDWNPQGQASHCAVGVSPIAGKIAKLGKSLKMEVAQVC